MDIQAFHRAVRFGAPKDVPNSKANEPPKPGSEKKGPNRSEEQQLKNDGWKVVSSNEDWVDVEGKFQKKMREIDRKDTEIPQISVWESVKQMFAKFPDKNF